MNSKNKLKKIQKLNIDFNDKDNVLNKGSYLEKSSILDRYLLIHTDKLYLFEIDFDDNRATQVKEIKSNEQLMLRDIFFIDYSNIFLKYSTGFQKYDIRNNKTSQIYFKKRDELSSPIDNIISINFTDIKPNKYVDQDGNFGLFATNSDLYISSISKDDREDKVDIICDHVKHFDDEIIKIYLNKYTSQAETSIGKEYILLIVVTKTSEKQNISVESINRHFQDISKWRKLFSGYEDEEDIKFSIQFDNNFNFPLSFVILREHYEFSKDLDNIKETISNKNIFEFQDDLKKYLLQEKSERLLKYTEIHSIHHNDSIIYVCLKTKVYIYNMKNSKIMDFWLFESEPIKDIYIYDNGVKEKKPYYNLVFHTSRNIYYSKIDKNFEDQGFHIKKPTIEESKKIRHSVASSYFSNHFFNCNLANCNKECSKRCSACKKSFYCSEEHQELDWPNHKKECTFEDNNLQIPYDLDNIESKNDQYLEKRKEIFLLLKDFKNVKNLNKAIDKGYKIIEESRKEVLKLNSNIKNWKTNMDKDDSLYLPNFINYTRSYEDYICNLLFLIYVISLKKSKDETIDILNKLVKEMEEKLEFHTCIDYITVNIQKFIDGQGPKDNQVHDLFLRYFKIVTTIAKLYYRLGEFSKYESKIIICVEKIETIYSSNFSIVLAYTYFLIGNLYIELDYLGKAIDLYNACIPHLINNLNSNQIESEFTKELYTRVLYNLGVLYYITDQYNQFKSKFDDLMKLYKNEVSEQMAMFYETKGEVELEYKNFQDSLNCLQKSLDIRTTIKSDNIKAKKKIGILLDTLMVLIEKDVEKKNMKKNTMINSDRGTSKNERDYEEILNYMKILNQEKANNYKTGDPNSGQNQDIDVDEMEKFFLFISKLTPKQIQVLDETQGNKEHPNYYKLPIVFSAEFKNQLSLNQRLEICNMKLMSLKKNKVLKDPTKGISIENLNYEVLSSRSFQNNLTNIENYFNVTRILKKNSEVNQENLNALTSSQNNIRKSHLSSNSPPTNRKTIVNFMNNSPISYSKKINNNPINTESGFSHFKPNTEIMSKKEGNDSEFINFCEVLRIYSENTLQKKFSIDDDEVMNIYKLIDKDEIKTILDNPEIFFTFIEEDKKNMNKSNIEEILEVEEDDDENERNKRNYDNYSKTSEQQMHSNRSLLNPSESKGTFQGSVKKLDSSKARSLSDFNDNI